MILIGFMSKLKGAFNSGGDIDSEIDKAFSSQAPVSKPTISERVLESQEKFGQQFQNRGKPVEILPKNDAGADFGRFDESFVSDKHLDNFDETKNIEDFSRLKPPQAPPPLQRNMPEAKDDMEFATATPRRNSPIAPASGDSSRIIEELEDLRAQNSEILRRIQRIEEKMRR